MSLCGRAVSVRLARWLALAAVALVLSAGSLYAQATGKVEGRVRDQAGAPIANAQVSVEGTAFGTLTNSSGYYFFNSLPVGSVNIQVAFVGYKRTMATGIRVLAGQTVTQDIQLEPTVVELDALTVVAAAQPLVPRDEVTTKQRIDGAYSEALPVDNLAGLLAL